MTGYDNHYIPPYDGRPYGPEGDFVDPITELTVRQYAERPDLSQSGWLQAPEGTVIAVAQ